MRQEYSQQSQIAYRSGNGAKAKGNNALPWLLVKVPGGFENCMMRLMLLLPNSFSFCTVELSLKSKEYGREMDRYNNMARDIVFKCRKEQLKEPRNGFVFEWFFVPACLLAYSLFSLSFPCIPEVNNTNRPSNELDLHGLKVREALDITRERLTKFVKNKEPNLIIIVGRGNNSVNGVAKIKPAVTELVNEFHIKATPNKPNQGCIWIEPAGPEGVDLSWIDDFFRGLAKKLWAYLFGGR
jgi:hypothetical protein